MFKLGSSFINPESTAVLHGAVQRRNRGLRLGGFCHLNERKSTGLTGIPILNNCDALDCAVSREKGSHLVFGADEIEVADKNVFQDVAPPVGTLGCSGKVIVMVFLSLLSLGRRHRTR